MFKNKYLLILIPLCGSCSSFRGSLLAGASAGGILGALAGSVLSPDRESLPTNALLFGALGSMIGMGAGYLIHEADPENRALPPMIIDPEKKFNPVPEGSKEQKEINLFDFNPDLKNLHPEINFIPTKKYEVPQEKLPDELKGKVKKQFILEYEVQPQTLQYNNRTIEIGPFKAWEHIYEQ